MEKKNYDNLIGKKIRIKPNENQLQLFRQYVGASRFAYNYYLKLRNRYYKIYGKTLGWMKMCNHFTKRKRLKRFSWCNDIPNDVFKTSFRDVDAAFSNFFKGIGKYPRFKSRKNTKQSFGAREDRISIKEGRFQIYPKTFGSFPTKLKSLPKIYNARVVYDNKYWYLTFSYEHESQMFRTKNKSIGIDLGIKTLAYLSNKTKYYNINKSKRVRSLKKKLKRLQRQVSRKYELNKQGKTFIKTKNIEKLEQRIRLISRQISNIRDTYIHTMTKEIIKLKPCKIVIEDLNVTGMMKNRHLSKAVAECNFSKIREYLIYKAKMYLNIEVTVADRFYPSSKTCHHCGQVKKDLKLSDRDYKCSCGYSNDRDYNAALNLKTYIA